MKILHLSIIVGIVIASITIMSILYLQISTLQDQNKALDETNQRLVANLTNYQDLFGTLSSNYTYESFALKTSVYVAEPLGLDPVTTVRVNQPYQVIANITKIKDAQPIIHYYCIVQITNATGLDPHIGWGEGTLIPKQTSSQCAVSWTPTSPGNYTLSAFAWRSLFGTPWSEAATDNVQVVSSYDGNKIPIKYANGTYMGFSLAYSITGNNKLLGANMTAEKNSDTLVLSLDASGNGTLTIAVPNMMDHMIHNQGAQLVVLRDGQEIDYIETKNGTHNVIISFPQGTRQVIMVAMVIW